MVKAPFLSPMGRHCRWHLIDELTASARRRLPNSLRSRAIRTSGVMRLLDMATSSAPSGTDPANVEAASEKLPPDEQLKTSLTSELSWLLKEVSVSSEHSVFERIRAILLRLRALKNHPGRSH
jgi:hypothetical protein